MRNLFMTIIYFLFLAPASLLQRLLHRDPLDRALDRTRDSYLVALTGSPTTGREATR